jgi:hypothetical protein
MRQCTKRGLSVDWKAQDYSPITGKHTEGDSLAEAICEVYKYAIKSKDIAEMDAGTLYHLARQISGKRLISSGGLIKRYMQMLDIEDMESVTDEDGEDSIEVCTKCGSTALDHLVATWSLSGGHYHIRSEEDDENTRNIAKILENNAKITQKEVKKAIADGNFTTHKLQKKIAEAVEKNG